jgi:hypothetical protein
MNAEAVTGPEMLGTNPYVVVINSHRDQATRVIAYSMQEGLKNGGGLEECRNPAGWSAGGVLIVLGNDPVGDTIQFQSAIYGHRSFDRCTHYDTSTENAAAWPWMIPTKRD